MGVVVPTEKQKAYAETVLMRLGIHRFAQRREERIYV